MPTRIGPSAWMLDSDDDILKAVSFMRKCGSVSFDLETTGLLPRKDKIVTAAFRAEGKRYVIDCRKRDMAHIGTLLEPLFGENGPEIRGHNLKFDLSMMWEKTKTIIAYNLYDTMIAQFVVTGLGYGEAKKLKIGFRLDDVYAFYKLGELSKEERKWFVRLDERPDEWEAPLPQEQLDYLLTDVDVIDPIRDAQIARAEKYGLVPTLELEMQCLPAIVGMETHGVYIEQAGYREVLRETQERKDELGQELMATLGPLILVEREKRYLLRRKPYDDWNIAEKHALDCAKVAYENGEEGQTFRTWGDYKKYYTQFARTTMREEWLKKYPDLKFDKKTGKPYNPPAIKDPPNLGSSDQLKMALNALELKDADGNVIVFENVQEKTLEEHAARFDILDKIIRYKKVDKLLASFGETLLEKIDPETGMIYPKYNQVGARTGRMSGYDPNFQQIPSRGELGARLRHYIQAINDEYTLVIADFSNIELRIAADMARDRALLKAFASRQDVHSMTAVTMFGLEIPEGVNPKDWTSEHKVILNGRTLDVNYRTVAKTINFMLFYGGGVQKLANMLGVSFNEAKALRERYFETYYGIDQFIKKQHQKVAIGLRKGAKLVKSKTTGGRCRFYTMPKAPEDDSEDALDDFKFQLSAIRRQMVNSPVQGTSADITKLALALWHKRVGYNPFMRLVGVVHDELLIQAHKSVQDEAARILAEVMQEAMQRYLKVVDTPLPEAVITSYWKH